MSSPEPAHSTPLAPGWRLWRVAALRGAGLAFGLLSDLTNRTEGVRRFLGDDRFVSAVAWQNPTAAGNWMLRHAEALRGGAELARRGTHDGLVARYAQRYCAKNDTIGFFGPVAWARFDPDAEGVRVAGSGGIRRRGVHLESWALRALADAWSADARLRPYLPVRRHPATDVEGELLRRGWRPAELVSPGAAALLAALRQDSTVSELVCAAHENTGRTAADLRAEIDLLHEAKVLDVGFLVPMDDRPERALRAQVRRVPDESARRELLAQLDELESARDAVSAAGDSGPRAVHEAIQDVISVLGKATGGAGIRAKGETRIGRVPVYQDCRRDLDVVLGADVLAPLRDPLAVLLASARWLVAEVADAVDARLRDRFAELRRRDPDVRLAALYLSVADVLSGAPGTVVHDVLDDFQLRWAELLPPAGAETVQLRAADLAPLVAALFLEQDGLWSTARYHSPDLLLARRPEGWQWVLGELHLALNTLENRVFHTQSDDPAALNDAIGADMAAGRVVALPPLDSPEVSPRTYPPLASHHRDRYVYWSYGWDGGAPEDAPSWPAAGLRVRESVGGLVVEPTDRSWTAPIREVLSELLSGLVVNLFQIRRPAPHLPRVVLDDVVVCRESWRIGADELPSAPDRVDALGERLHALGLPRHVFARTVAEAKPCYVDLKSPLLLRNLARALRLLADRPERDRYVDFSEMVPGPDELWVPDGAGQPSTAEFRVVVVDETPAVPINRAPAGRRHSDGRDHD